MIKVNESQTRCFVHYDGYESSWDEWVGADRIHVERRHHGDWEHSKSEQQPYISSNYHVGQHVMAYWKNSWYPAVIIEESRHDQGKFKIHYEGYGSDWDEWLWTDRLRRK